ncbi:uncharacterized protein LOC144866419 [Branchiostoma floridae x Branchiostoma japonicum]
MWTIEVNTGQGVRIAPQVFALEENYDWLSIWEGESDDPTLLGGWYTGKQIDVEILTTSNLAYIVLSTDESVPEIGFEIYFEAFDLAGASCPDPGVPNNGYRTGDSFAVGSVVSFGCNDGYTLLGPESLTCMSSTVVGWNSYAPNCKDSAHACVADNGSALYEEEGEIQPLYDEWSGDYLNNMDCSWTITADPGKVVVVEFLEFDVEYESRCRYDFLELRDKPYMNFYQYFCGRSLPPVYVSMTPFLAIYFHSDEIKPGTGFKIHYYLQEKSEDDPQGYQRIHYLSEDTGAFSSMNYPHYPYRNHVYQHWNITVDIDKAVRLTFVDFDVDFGSQQECKDDYVLISDPYALVRTYWCGPCVPPARISADHRLYVIFVTDFVIRRAGFSARYEAVDKRPEPSTPDFLARPDWLVVRDRIKHISVSANQVWALETDGTPLRRTGITKTTPQGTGWEVVGTERFKQISVGRAGVWAVYDDSTVMYRVGTYGNSETAGLRWQTVHIDSYTNALFNFEKWPVETPWYHEIDWIQSGRNLVWITGTLYPNIYGDTIVRKGISPETPEGKSWVSAGAANMNEISVSSRTGQLWAVEWDGRLWRSPFYCEISAKYDWETVDGCFQTSVSVGPAGVWVVGISGDVVHRAGTYLNETSPGEEWVHVPAPTLKRVAVGDGIVWGIDDNNRVFAYVLPTPTDEDVCQVGLRGHSRCYAIQKEKRLCAEDEIICPYSGKCILECSVCDGIVDCGDDDDTDERNCWLAACPEKHRRMCYGDLGCYSPSRVCDGEWNCGEDKEDERDCSDSCIVNSDRGSFLRRDLVQCRDLKGCVKITKVCDGKRDCSDGSDEIRCDEFCSLHGLFGDTAFWKCRNVSGCIKGEFLCDGTSDCEDGSDEDSCDEYDVCGSIGYWPCRSSLPPFPKCISRQERCDRHVDCRDFSDEIGCEYLWT